MVVVRAGRVCLAMRCFLTFVLAGLAGVAIAPRPLHACVPAPCIAFDPAPDQIFPSNHVAFALPAEPPADLTFESADGAAIAGQVQPFGKHGRAFRPLAPLPPGAYRLRYRPAACLGPSDPRAVAFTTTDPAPLPTATGKLTLVSQRSLAQAAGPALELGFELTASPELARFGNVALPIHVDGRIVTGPGARPQWRPGQAIPVSLVVTCAPGPDKDGWSGEHSSCGSLYRSVPAGRHTLSVPAFIWGIDPPPAPAELPFEVVCEGDQARVVAPAAPDAGCQMAPGARATAPLAVALLALLLLALRSRPAPSRVRRD